jgi:hypothetical protein
MSIGGSLTYLRKEDTLKENETQKTPDTEEEIRKRKAERKRIILDFIKDNLANSQSHGIPKIIKEENKIVKLMWVFCVIASSIACLAIIIINVVGFYKYEVTTKIRTVHELPTTYPTVKICNKNMFTTSFGLSFIKDIIKVNNLTDIFDKSANSQWSTMNISDKTKAINEAILLSKQNAFSLSDQDKRSLSYDISDILISCSFDGRECVLTDFIWRFDRFFGSCFIFNSGFDQNGDSVPLKVNKQPGKFNGLKLLIYDGLSDDFKKIYQDYGLTIKIDNSSNQNVQWKDSIDLFSNIETNIAVERIYSYQLTSPYSNCEIDNVYPKVFESELYNLFSANQHPYKQQYCIGNTRIKKKLFTIEKNKMILFILDLCFQKLAIATCDCSDNESINFYNSLPCTTLNKIKCLENTYNNVFLNGDYISKNCKPLCPLECKKIEFKTTSSFSVFSNDIYVPNVNDTTNSSDANKMSLVKFNIYYESLAYTLINETQSIDAFILLSSIGGTFGLFLGASFLSFIEIVEVFIEAIYLYKKEKNKVTSSDNITTSETGNSDKTETLA